MFVGQMEPNEEILVSDWLLLTKPSPLKLLGQMEPNLAETRIALGGHVCWPNGTI
jgi:hypothetical protein